MSGYNINKHVDVWEREGVFGTFLIKFSEFNAHSPLVIFLSYYDNIG